MNPNVAFYITALFFLIVILLITSVFYALNYGLSKLEIPPQKKKFTILLTSLFLGVWLFISSWLALSGKLLDFTSVPPKMLLILIPSILAVIYISSSTRVNLILTVIPSPWLVYVQSFRVLVEVFLWLMFLQNIIPKQMTFEGINYDMLTGLSAPLIAYFALSEKKWPRIVTILWNFAGLLLVANITIVAILSLPGPMRQFFNEPSNTIVAYFPFVWIPGVIVPFAFLMHILSIKQIIRNYN